MFGSQEAGDAAYELFGHQKIQPFTHSLNAFFPYNATSLKFKRYIPSEPMSKDDPWLKADKLKFQCWTTSEPKRGKLVASPNDECAECRGEGGKSLPAFLWT